MHRTALKKTTLISEIPNITNKETIIALGQGTSVLRLRDKVCEEQAFAYLLARGKFGYSVP